MPGAGGSQFERQIRAAKAEGPPDIGWLRRWFRHPIRYARWRVDVRRRGPYALDFDEWQRSKPDETSSDHTTFEPQ